MEYSIHFGLLSGLSMSLKMTSDPRHILSKDGSSTLYSPIYQQFYHNPNGAIAESRHVFFETPGLDSFFSENKSLTILEVGFGTGLNFLLATDYYLKNNCTSPLHFYSIEVAPVTSTKALELNYAEQLSSPDLAPVLPNVFKELNSGLNIIKPVPGSDITLHLFIGDFVDADFKDLTTDFIFHDPFSPEVNEELWSSEVFERLLGFSRNHTILTTYCAASKARGAMANAGWFTARAKGALGKREMTLASPDKNQLNGYKFLNNERLAERYRNGAFS